MKNSFFCITGYTLLLTSILMFLLSNNKERLASKFDAELNDKQKKLFKEVSIERRNIYLLGTIIGLIVGLLYIYKSPDTKYKFCIFLTIFFIIKIFIYKIYPKSTFMTYHLTTQEQIKKWTDMYTYMKNKYMLSFVMSLISVGLITYFK